MKKSPIISMFFLLLFVGCSNNTFTIAIDNRTDNKIGTLSVYVQGKEYKVENVQPKNKLKLLIKKNELYLNSHDFRIETKNKKKDGEIINGFYYSDLSGSPNSKYTIEVYDSQILIC